MKKILITGSKGKIGLVLHKRLADSYDVIGLDLPESDVSDYDFLLGKMQGVDTVIHVTHSHPADKTMAENWRSGKIDPMNVLLEMNVFKAVVETGVKRLIVASSVHADNFTEYEGKDLLTVPGSYAPICPYGAHKLVTEEIGRFYSRHYPLEYVGVRFGGVSADDSIKMNDKEPFVYLSYRDLGDAIEACVNADSVPDSYCVFYAVSDNEGRMHDTSNPFGWVPKDNSKDHLVG